MQTTPKQSNEDENIISLDLNLRLPPNTATEIDPGWQRIQAIFAITNDLHACRDLDSLCRRIVELARERLGVERCSLFLLDSDAHQIYGTYGTDMQGRTVDEHHLSWQFKEAGHGQHATNEDFWYLIENEESNVLDNQPFRKWVGYTWMKQSPDTVALFCNDSAISGASPDHALQQAIAIYCSIVYGLIRRLKIEQALQASELRFHAIFDAINDAVFLHDRDSGEILTVNQKACEMFGYSVEELKRLSIGDLSEAVPPYSQQDGIAYIQRACEGESQLFEWRARHRSGMLFWVEVNLRLASIGPDQRVMVTVRDINQRKQAEQIHTAMYKIAATSVATQDLPAFYPQIHEIIGELMPARNFYIALYDPVNDLISVPYYVDQYDPPPPPQRPQQGLTAHVLHTGKPLLLKREAHLAIKEKEGIETIGTPAIDWLGVPLITNQGMLGMMTVQTYDEHERLTEADRDVLLFVSNQVAMTIQRKRAEEHQQHLSHGLRAVIEATDELLQINDLDTLYRRAVELGREKIGLERCGIFLLDARQEYLLGTYGTDAQGHTTDEHEGCISAIDKPEVFSPLDLMYTIITKEQTRQRNYWEHGQQVQLSPGWIVATIIHNGAIPLGVLYNDAAISDSPFDPALQEATAVYCSMLGSIIDRKKLEEFEKRSIQRLNGVVQSADELIAYTEPDTLYRRAVELAREKLGVERCAIFLVTPGDESLHGTYGTNGQGQTTDEHSARWASLDLQRAFQSQNLHWAVIEERYGYWQDNHFTPLTSSGWIAHTLIRVGNQIIGVFVNDAAINQGPTDGMLQETLHLYCSLLGNLIQRLQSEAERKMLITELSAKNAELERFTYTVSHDLKAPLITIRGFLGFLEKDAIAGNLSRVHSDIERIIQATNKMQQLLEDLLELSRIGRIVAPLQDVPFSSVVEDALELLKGSLTQCGASVDVAPDLPIIHGDRARLVEVIQNLVENAIKFMGDQPQPHIIIGVRHSENSDLPILFVQDNGIGIEPIYHERIFGLFDKLDARSEGTGIGLALVRRIIEVHGGQTWVESEGTGHGATFCFTLRANVTE